MIGQGYVPAEVVTSRSTQSDQAVEKMCRVPAAMMIGLGDSATGQATNGMDHPPGEQTTRTVLAAIKISYLTVSEAASEGSRANHPGGRKTERIARLAVRTG